MSPQTAKKREPWVLTPVRSHRRTDGPIIQTVGTKPYISVDELAVMLHRSYSQVSKRTKQLILSQMMGRIKDAEAFVPYYEEIVCDKCENVIRIARNSGRWQGPTPYLLYLKPKAVAGMLPEMREELVVIEEKGHATLSHDRKMTVVQLAFEHFFGEALYDFRRSRGKLIISVTLGGQVASFIPDGSCRIGDRKFYIEFMNATPSSSREKGSPLGKMEFYNELLKDKQDENVIFIFADHVRENCPTISGKELALNFLKRASEEFPFYWCKVTDFETLKERANGEIFWTPKDFSERTYGLIEQGR